MTETSGILAHPRGALTWADLPVEWRADSCFWRQRDHADPADYTMEQIVAFRERSACPLCIDPESGEYLYAEVSRQLEYVSSHFDGLTEQNTGERPPDDGKHGPWTLTRSQLEGLLADNPAPRAWLDIHGPSINLTVTDG